MTDALLALFDDTGTLVWAYTYGGAFQEEARSVRSTTDGGFLLTGYTYSFGAGNYDLLLVKVDGLGTLNWSLTAGGSGMESGVCGLETADGGFAALGRTDSYGAGGDDRFLVKWDSGQSFQWARALGGVDRESAAGMFEAADTDLIVAGSTYSYGSGDQDVLVLTVSATGSLGLERTFGWSVEEECRAIREAANGDILLASHSTSSGPGSYAAHILRLDDLLNPVWSRCMGGPGSEYAHSIRSTAEGGVVAAGATASFGAGSTDYLLMKTGPTGVLPGCPHAISCTPIDSVPSLFVDTPSPGLDTPSLSTAPSALAVTTALPTHEEICGPPDIPATGPAGGVALILLVSWMIRRRRLV